mmetsp:Transcript_9334/g.13605  ORF Transcript_9334/g.13605 Transcript_9334/m.13605 type:complete len:86 (-) Transcript_9334:290-547(-)
MSFPPFPSLVFLEKTIRFEPIVQEDGGSSFGRNLYRRGDNIVRILIMSTEIRATYRKNYLPVWCNPCDQPLLSFSPLGNCNKILQ